MLVGADVLNDVVLMTDAWDGAWREGGGRRLVGGGVRVMFDGDVFGVYSCDCGAKTDFGCRSSEGRDFLVGMLRGGGLVAEEGGGGGLELPGSHTVGRGGSAG